MNEVNDDGLRKLVKSSLPRISMAAGPERDLWPEVLGRMHEAPNAMPWFDWALVGGLVVFVAAFPVSISLFLYYL